MVAEAETETIKCGLYPQVVESNGVAIGVDSVGDCGMEVSGAGSVLSEVK